MHHGPSDHTSGHWLVVNELSRKSMTGVKNPVYFCRASMSSHGTCAGELSTNCEGKVASLDKQQKISCQHTTKYIWYKNISAEWALALAAQTRRVAAMTSARVPHPQVHSNHNISFENSSGLIMMILICSHCVTREQQHGEEEARGRGRPGDQTQAPQTEERRGIQGRGKRWVTQSRIVSRKHF